MNGQDRLAGLRDSFGVPSPWTLLGYVPWTVAVVAALCWVLAAGGIRFHDVFSVALVNPLVYVVNGLFHEDWAHFAGNMRFWIPFGVVFTWLTSNRHLLSLALVSQVLATVVSLAIGQYGVGLSVVVFAVAAATLVRACGMAFGEGSSELLQAGVTMAFGPLLGGFLFVAVLAGGNSPIGHFAHFFGFLFGGAMESMYVFSKYDDGDSGRQVPERIGR